MFPLEGDPMNPKWWLLIIALASGIYCKMGDSIVYAQKPGTTFTILYSNNINGEISPCPT
jgi:hypothetical protein